MCLRFDASALDPMRCGEPMLCDALVRSPDVGRRAFPFIGQGKAGVIAKGKREKEREIRLPGVCRPPLRVGLVDPIDRGGSGVAPGPCWPL